MEALQHLRLLVRQQVSLIRPRLGKETRDRAITLASFRRLGP